MRMDSLRSLFLASLGEEIQACHDEGQSLGRFPSKGPHILYLHKLDVL